VDRDYLGADLVGERGSAQSDSAVLLQRDGACPVSHTAPLPFVFVGGFDLSPIVLIIGIEVVRMIVVSSLVELARQISCKRRSGTDVA
jgi:hypothetical protein